MQQKIPSAIAQLESAVDEATATKLPTAQPDLLAGAGQTLPAGNDGSVPSLDDALAAEEAKSKTPIDATDDYTHADSVTPPLEAERSELEKAQARFDVLNGKYKAEVPALHEKIRDLEYELAYTSEAATQDVFDIGDAKQPDAPAYARYLSKDETEDYGDEVLEMQSRVIRGVVEDVAGRKIRDLESTIFDLRQQLASTPRQTSEDLFWVEVEAEFPGAKDINDNDVVFHAFLGEEDPMSGVPNRDIGQAALQKKDVGRIVALMQRYASEYGVTAPSGKGKTGPKVKPKRSRGSSAGESAPDANLIKESEIRKFYKDITNPQIRKQWTDEQIKAREEEYDKAMKEGRVIR